MAMTEKELALWELKMLDETALKIGKALNALPEEYANAHYNHEVGGNLHSAIGFLIAARGSLRRKLKALEALEENE